MSLVDITKKLLSQNVFGNYNIPTYNWGVPSFNFTNIPIFFTAPTIPTCYNGSSIFNAGLPFSYTNSSVNYFNLQPQAYNFNFSATSSNNNSNSFFPMVNTYTLPSYKFFNIDTNFQQQFNTKVSPTQNPSASSTITGTTKGNSIVSFAKQFVGKNEYDGSADMFWKGLGINWSSKKYGWCAAYVSYCLVKCGVNMSGAHKGSPEGLRSWGKKNGTYITGASANASSIKPGDVVVWIGDKYFKGHTGIVTEVFPDGTYNTIEGNTSNKVCERKGKGTGQYKISQTTGFIKIS